MTNKATNPKDAIGDTKLPLALLSPIAKAHWALGQFVGMLKYGAWNWRAAGVRSSVYLSAIERHLSGYVAGEETDPVDGTHHLGNIMACCAILLEARAIGKLMDDRPPKVNIRPTYAELEALMARLKEQYKDKDPKHYTIDDTEYRLEEDYCAVCDHDLCQCPQDVAERPVPEAPSRDWTKLMAGDKVKVLSEGVVVDAFADGLYNILFEDESQRIFREEELELLP